MKEFWKVIIILVLFAFIICHVNGQWESWSTWSTCSATCDGGNQTRTRICANNSTVNCTGEDEDFRACNTDHCPVIYVQLCPLTMFSCHTGSVKCVSRDVMCDCTSDCSDGSDETTNYAGCTQTALGSCATTDYEKECERCYTEIVACVLVVPFALFTMFQLFKIYRILT